MNDMRKLMEAVDAINEAPILSVENEEVEQHLDAAAKALAKDAVLQASGVWDEEGRDEGGYDTGAKTGKEYVNLAAPGFLDDEYKKSIMASFQNSFNEHVQNFLGYVGETVEYDGEVVKCDDCGSTDVSSDSFTDDDGNDRTEYTCNKCDTGWEY